MRAITSGSIIVPRSPLDHVLEKMVGNYGWNRWAELLVGPAH
jgi:hypothetical protein